LVADAERAIAVLNNDHDESDAIIPLEETDYPSVLFGVKTYAITGAKALGRHSNCHFRPGDQAVEDSSL
jgi:hypothetical protein